jgi:hypothetical protein
MLHTKPSLPSPYHPEEEPKNIESSAELILEFSQDLSAVTSKKSHSNYKIHAITNVNSGFAKIFPLYV